MEWSYYGRLSGNKPRIGVVYFMIDQHVKMIIEKTIKDFKDELVATLSEFKNDSLAEIKTLRTKLGKLEAKVDILKKSKSISEEETKDDQLAA